MRFWLLAALWLALALPHLNTRYCFNWDSANFDRGVRDFDIARHQPHPPGYPLWVLALKGITPLTGNPNSAQVVLALIFTIGGIWCFLQLARDEVSDDAIPATVLFAFSPLVCLYAYVPLTYAVDLFASCAIGWMASRLWRGDSKYAPLAFALAGLTAGFRQSGVTFLLPLLLAALWRCRRAAPVRCLIALATGVVCWLVWYIPTALLTGGFSALSALDRAQMLSGLRQTSAFFGAPLLAHAHMIADTTLYFAMALIALAFARPRHNVNRAFFALWALPNLVFLYLFHCGQPGYILLSLPPLVLSFNRFRWTPAIVALSLAAGYFPYQRLVNPAVPTVAYQLLRSSPGMAGLVQSDQRDLRSQIDSIPQKRIVCLRTTTEAPNIRTVDEDYPDVHWLSLSDAASARAWLCNGLGHPKLSPAACPK